MAKEVRAMRLITGPGEIFAAKLFILALASVILTVASSLLMRGMHKWITRENLKKAAFALTLFIVFAVLVLAGEEILQQPKIGGQLFILTALIILKAYKSGNNLNWGDLFSKKLIKDPIRIGGVPVCLICVLAMVPCVLTFSAYCAGCSMSTSAIIWVLATLAIFATIGIYADTKSNK